MRLPHDQRSLTTLFAMRIGLATAAVCLAAATPAYAEIKQAESVMPPGNSGFVSGPCLAENQASGTYEACDPHLIDQIPLFTEFNYKSSLLGQKPGGPIVPKDGVEIYRDDFGVPSIYGTTETNTWWGMGYAVAQDRLFQIEAFRRATTGTLAELTGKGALEDDIIARRDFYTEAERMEMIDSLSGDLKDRWQAYADGVNAWIAEASADPGELPAEFVALGATPEPLEIHEMAAIGIYLARTTSSGDGDELANLEALQSVGRKAFDRVFPLRTPGQIGTVPRSDGLFPSRPGRTRKDERIAFRRSVRFAKHLPLPDPEADPAAEPSASMKRFFPDLSGSKMWAMRKGGNAWMFTGPQLGFIMPQRLVEVEIHSPSLDVRGVTAAGVPVIGIGHNQDVAWGLTSALADENDLYVEQLVGDEGYRFRGRTEAMECREETFNYQTPPADFLSLLGIPPEVPEAEAGSETRRLCRTMHGPVQARADGVAYARRYPTWKQEIGTIIGLDQVNRASSIDEVDAAAEDLTWNENLMAADDQGNIGFWNPGLLPLRPKRWDERLPFPGTGRAEWKRYLRLDELAQSINPKRGWLANWNNPPSFGATNGDGPAKERTIGPFHRGRYLQKVVKRLFLDASYDASKEIERISGTHAQQRMLATSRLKKARRRSKGDARVVLDTILAWDGDYHTTDDDGNVPAGVAAWDAFCAGAETVAMRRYPEEIGKLGHSAGGSHLQECATLEAFGLRTLGKRGYRRAAVEAMETLATPPDNDDPRKPQFGSKDPDAWRIERPTYPVGAEGAGSFPEPFPFFDRGTWTEVTELGT